MKQINKYCKICNAPEYISLMIPQEDGTYICTDCYALAMARKAVQI